VPFTRPRRCLSGGVSVAKFFCFFSPCPRRFPVRGACSALKQSLFNSGLVPESYNFPVKIRMPMAMNAIADRYFI
jgi:hypothetical protein